MSLRFDEKVAIVTGAGGGLGRTYALLLASRGAKVVVNDLGGGVKGEAAAAPARPADVVVDEIRKAGGQAVANYDSVEHGDKIVKTAVDAWGRVDIVINNAGILRDVSFLKMKDVDWDLIMKVHLTGAYTVTKAAWPYMRDQGYGRIIMTSSGSGLYGNAGQANYAAAKIALVGFAQTLAKEGASRNIRVNAIAPVAGTRMTASVMPEELVAALKPEYVAPLVAYLAHEGCEATGQTFEVGAGWVAAVRWERARGGFFNVADNAFTPESVRDKFAEVCNFDKESTYPTGPNDALGPIMANLEASKPAGVTAVPTSGKNDHVDVALALSHKMEPKTFEYTARDVATYALCVGMARDPMNEQELPFVYENSADFRALPSMAVVFPFSALGDLTGAPGLNFNPMMLLHGEQYLELRGPLPTEGKVTSQCKISGIYDKGKGALVTLDCVTRDSAGKDICFNQYGLFIRGIGGFGGAKSPKVDSNEPPARAPDAVQEDKTAENLALHYRWPGVDLNPLHADPSMAAMGGFDRPILHGLCTFGHAARAVLQHFANYDTAKLRSIRVRFTRHVFPGETIVTQMWKEGNKVLFVCRVKERPNDAPSISGGCVELTPGAKM